MILKVDDLRPKLLQEACKIICTQAAYVEETKPPVQLNV